MKKRLKSWITSIFGVSLMIAAVILFAFAVINLFAMIVSIVLGWVLLMGKDEWIREIWNDLKGKIG